MYKHKSLVHPFPEEGEWKQQRDFTGAIIDATRGVLYNQIKLESIEKNAAGFYVNKRGEYAFIMQDDTLDSRRAYAFTDMNTRFDDDIAFMVFQDAPFKKSDGKLAYSRLQMPSSIQHDGETHE